MHDAIEIGKVPGRVMSETFKYRVENLTASFQNFTYDNTSAPKKKGNKPKEKGDKGIMEMAEVPEGPPEAYFKVAIQFFGSEYDSTAPLVYPPIGKHILCVLLSLPPFLFTFSFFLFFFDPKYMCWQNSSIVAS